MSSANSLALREIAVLVKVMVDVFSISPAYSGREGSYPHVFHRIFTVVYIGG